MDANNAMTIDSSIYGGDGSKNDHSSNNNGWQKVVSKRPRKPIAKHSSDGGGPHPNGTLPASSSSNVFLELEMHAEDRRRRKIDAQNTLDIDVSVPPARSRHQIDDESDSGDDAALGGLPNGNTDPANEIKPKKVKKPKKPKVTVAEAASIIDAHSLSCYLIDELSKYDTKQDIQLTQFTEYFERKFSAVSSSQFPWTKMFRESPLAKIAEVPICHILEPVYITSVDWINLRNHDALCSHVSWSLSTIQSPQLIPKGRNTPSKSRVHIFVVLAMILRCKPDILVSLLPTLKNSFNFPDKDFLPFVVWVIAQASHGDRAVGFLCWSHLLLPLAGEKTTNPQARDLVLQFVERTLSDPKAETSLVKSAVRRGERLLPPSSFETLMRITFPAPSARVKATARFEAIYPTLKKIAIAGAPGSKAMKQVSSQIMSFALKAAAESIPELSMEASDIFIWCLKTHPDCYKQWERVYLQELGGTVAVLKRMAESWKAQQRFEKSSLDSLKKTLLAFRHKNKIGSGSDSGLLKEADIYCKIILGKLSGARSYFKGIAAAAFLGVVMYKMLEVGCHDAYFPSHQFCSLWFS